MDCNLSFSDLSSLNVLCRSEPSPKEKGVVSPPLGILFLVSELVVSLILQDYYGPIRHFSHLFCRMLLILPDIFLVCLTTLILTDFTTCTFFCTFLLQLYHKSPSVHLRLGLLTIYLSLSMLQSANSGISVLQIAHTVLLILLV